MAEACREETRFPAGQTQLLSHHSVETCDPCHTGARLDAWEEGRGLEAIVLAQQSALSQPNVHPDLSSGGSFTITTWVAQGCVSMGPRGLEPRGYSSPERKSA